MGFQKLNYGSNNQNEKAEGHNTVTEVAAASICSSLRLLQTVLNTSIPGSVREKYARPTILYIGPSAGSQTHKLFSKTRGSFATGLIDGCCNAISGII